MGKTVRDRSQKALKALRRDVEKQNWSDVRCNEVNITNDSFKRLLHNLYENIRKVRRLTKNDAVNNPWIIKGLQNVGKIKYLYSFLKLKTKEAESK